MGRAELPTCPRVGARRLPWRWDRVRCAPRRLAESVYASSRNAEEVVADDSAGQGGQAAEVNRSAIVASRPWSPASFHAARAAELSRIGTTASVARRVNCGSIISRTPG